MENIKTAIDTPWKAINEAKMYLLKPVISIYLRVNNVKIEGGYKFYGMPKILRHRESKIKIGANFENRNTWDSNPLGLWHPTILCTWSKNALITIGNDVGISGGSIVSATKIEIGNGVLIGANCTIIDTDFHPTASKNRRYDKKGIKSEPVKIGNNVFIGMNSIILKGVTIPDNAIVPAGSVITRKTKFN